MRIGRRGVSRHQDPTLLNAGQGLEDDDDDDAKAYKEKEYLIMYKRDAEMEINGLVTEIIELEDMGSILLQPTQIYITV